MLVRKLVIRNFRGIRELDWATDSRFVCLIGPGDAGKSTILDAVALALEPRWNVTISDSDFYGCDPSLPIEIVATLTGLPAGLRSESACGLWLRGISPNGVLNDEPQEGDEVALTIRFSADESLEPKWELVKEAMPEPRRITATERALLGVAPVGSDSEVHLKWVRGSALARAVENAETAGVLMGAYRQARTAVFENPSDQLNAAAGQAAELLKKMGGAVLTSPRAGLDPGMMRRGAPLVLHDGDIPATGLGRGSQRLAGLAFQLASLDSESIVLVDEIEFGLEPHRLMHLLNVLKDRSAAGTGQVILTTHSPLVVEAVEASDLCVVRSEASATGVRQVPTDLDDMRPSEPQATVRSGPSAMLASRVVVCEGKTEVGLCRALVATWDGIEDVPMVLAGTAVRHGGGTDAPNKARCLALLGYPTMLLVDDDLDAGNRASFTADADAAIADGVSLLRWESGYSIEQQIVAELPEASLSKLVELAIQLADCGNPVASIVDGIAAKLDVPAASLIGLDPVQWAADTGKTGPEIRAALGLAAKKGEWFKNESKGEKLGQLLVSEVGALPADGTLVAVLDQLRDFMYGRVPQEAEVEAVADN